MRETGICLSRPEATFSHRAAALIIKDGKLLAAKGTNSPYYISGGVIELNESSEEAVRREVWEEIGLRLEIDKLAFINERFFRVGKENLHEIVFLFNERGGYSYRGKHGH